MGRHFFLFCLCCWAGAGAAAAPTEPAVKAALVANLSNYVEWSENVWSAQHTQLCIAGRGSVVESIQALHNQILLGRRIAVSYRSWPGDGQGCQVLFLGDAIGHGQGEWLQEWTTPLAKQPVLTVCEGDDFVSHGCMIGLVRQGTQVAFDVNMGALRRANLRLSAHLLRLARTLYGKP